mmetsp:Transcript_38043/g.63157  ORF Transcript_38043/g.63157 Transcript_38043/m.63157 type:complete len:91 (+) Transcript_38043:404-676(+)
MSLSFLAMLGSGRNIEGRANGEGVSICPIAAVAADEEADPLDPRREDEGEREEDLDSVLMDFPPEEEEMGVNGTGADDDSDPDPDPELEW